MSDPASPAAATVRKPAPLWCKLALGLLLAAGVLIRMPSLGVGFMADDWTQLSYLHGEHGHFFRHSLDLYNFGLGEPEAALAQVREGWLPWWFDPETKVVFLRPLSSATLWLDQAVAPMSAAFAHGVNLLWFLAFVWLGWRLLARHLPGYGAAIGAAVLLFTPAAFLPLLWVCARHVLIASVFSLAFLLAHIRWRQEGWRPGGLLAPLCLALALLAGEGGVQAFAYLAAYELLVESPGLPARVRRLSPSFLVLLGYFAVRSAWEAGVAASAAYVDPLTDPSGWMANAVHILPGTLSALVSGGFAAVALEIRAEPLAWAAGALFLPVMAFALLRARQRNPEAWKRSSWLWLGALVSVAVVFSSRAMVRPWSLLLTTVGVAAAVSVGLRALWGTARDLGSRRSLRVLAAAALVLIVLDRFVAPMAQAPALLLRSGHAQEWDRQLAQVGETSAAHSLVLCSDREVLRDMFGVGGTAFTSLAVLAQPHHGCEVERPREDELLIRDTSGSWVVPARSGFRSAERPLSEGEQVELAIGTVTVDSVSAGEVRAIRFRFHGSRVPEELATWVFEDPGVARRIQLPPVGGSLLLPSRPAPAR